MDAGFVKIESTNLPRIDAFMVGDYFTKPRFLLCGAEKRQGIYVIQFKLDNGNYLLDSERLWHLEHHPWRAMEAMSQYRTVT
ncbi:hypothetical protein evm_007668 [Chilo suppressalis]|nr:hypothetical protein evm_007668 [Chilo suppressalis]